WPSVPCSWSLSRTLPFLVDYSNVSNVATRCRSPGKQSDT
ncbi:MAG: hypothetical protein AVDCRST_MAG58-2351, partial [uncultured Rubrobacteraceae bacterium]